MIQTLSFRLNRIESTTYILFKNTLPIHNVLKILLYKESGLTGSFSRKMFRYSFDNVIWSDWETLNIVNVTNVMFNNDTNVEFFIEVKYYRNNIQSADIEDFYIIYNSEYESDDYGNVINGIDNYVNGVDNIGAVFSEIKNNNGKLTAYLKNIVGKDHVIVSQDKETIYISLDSSLDVKYQNENIITNPLGDVIGDYFKDGKSFSEVMEDLFFPAMNPIIEDPSIIDFSVNKMLLPYKEQTELDIKTIFSKGLISYKDGSTAVYPRTGEIIGFKYRIDDNILGFFETNLESHSFDVSVNLDEGIYKIGVDVLFNEGIQPVKTNGEKYDKPYPAGYLSNEKEIECVYRIFATTESTLYSSPLEKLYSMIDGNNIEIELVNEINIENKQFFEIPSKLVANMNNIKCVQIFNPITNKYETPTYNTWRNDAIVKNIQGNNINYIKYIYNGPKRGRTKINIVFNGKN